MWATGLLTDFTVGWCCLAHHYLTAIDDIEATDWVADAASLQVVVLVVDVVETDIGDAGGILDGKGSNYS